MRYFACSQTYFCGEWWRFLIRKCFHCYENYKKHFFSKKGKWGKFFSNANQYIWQPAIIYYPELCFESPRIHFPKFIQFEHKVCNYTSNHLFSPLSNSVLIIVKQYHFSIIVNTIELTDTIGKMIVHHERT